MLMTHALSKVLLEQSQQAHAQLLSRHEAVLQENFNQWPSYARKKANILMVAQQNKTSNANTQNIEQCIQMIIEAIWVEINHEIRELTRISRQAAIINLLAAFLALVSVVIVVFILL